jgi:Putative Flp pilus-assembly TadE/G-like
MKNLVSFLKFKDSGNVAIMTALVVPMLVGGAGFAVETVYWYRQDLQLQQAADKAAYAGALALRAGQNISAIRAAATAMANANGFTGTPVTNWPPTSGPNAGNVRAVEVLATQQLPRFFSSVIREGMITEDSRAVALTVPGAEACVLALSPSANAAVNVAGNANLSLTGCVVMANSNAANGVQVQNAAALLQAECVVSVGGVQFHDAGSTILDCAAAMTQQPPTADPLAGLPEPPNGANGTYNAATRTYSPGYFPSGMSFTGNQTYTLNPGVYVLNGNFSASGSGTINGTGVTIFMRSGSVSLNGNTRINLTAPTTGTYAGVLFFGGRTNTASNTFNGTSNSRLTGILYFPGQALSYLGNFSGTDGCTLVIANTVSWSGATNLNQDCTHFNFPPVPATSTIALVE